MEAEEASTVTRLKSPIENLSITKSQLESICERLEAHARQAAEHEIDSIREDIEQAEDPESVEENIRDKFHAYVKVNGQSGEELFGTVSEVFESPNFPDYVESVFISSRTMLGSYDYSPRNYFEIFLDFRKTNPINLTLKPSVETPNASNIEVRGFESAWANGVYGEFKRLVENNGSMFHLLHNHSIYDLGLWLFWVPIILRVIYKLSDTVDSIFGSYPQIVEGGVYLYIVVILLFIFKQLFLYARWVWPSMEFKHNNSNHYIHRLSISAIFASIMSVVIVDLATLLL